MIRAVIDIGTNTAHVLIGQVRSGVLEKIIYKKRFYTFLGDNGLEFIDDEAISRLDFALSQFKKSIVKYHCEKVLVIATEGLRSAANGEKIYQSIQDKYKWHVMIISGDEESKFIYQGAQQSVNMSRGSFLIMDIGGGSVEFVWVIDGVLQSKASYPIGISRLYQSFHRKDPIENVHIRQMTKHLDKVLSGMWKQIKEYIPHTQLVGCAGTFEIFMNEQELKDHNVSESTVLASKIDRLLSIVMHQDLKDRSLVKDLPRERAKYIVVALLLVNYVMKGLKRKDFAVSKYALKEGAIIDDRYFDYPLSAIRNQVGND